MPTATKTNALINCSGAINQFVGTAGTGPLGLNINIEILRLPFIYNKNSRTLIIDKKGSVI